MIVRLVLTAASIGAVLLPGKKPKGTEADKFQSLVSSGIGLPPVPKLDQTEDRASLVQEKSDYDPCKTSKDMCQNKGKCINRDGEFMCQCPPTHYGKRCERIADTRFCQGHQCQNNATCLSTDKNETFVNPVALREFKQKNPNEVPNPKSFMITVRYHCICADGYVGEFCQITEEERSCEEDYCSSHGRGHYDPESGCTCECDPQDWIGERCDIRSPCAHYGCMNTAGCTLKDHPQQNLVEAVCNCPVGAQFVPASITGNHCERITTDYSNHPLVPCRKNGNFFEWYNTMQSNMRGRELDLSNLKEILDMCVMLDGRKCETDTTLQRGWCYYGGECHVRAEAFASGMIYLTPYCECKGAESGRFCEYHRKDACDPTAVEKESGVTRENRCTGLHNGHCIAPEGIALCDCFPGYVGEQCEIYDPCSRNPCGKSSECVAIPDETEVRGDLSAQNYRCLCGMSDDIDEKNPAQTKCVYSGTGNCSRAKNPCNRGECLSCEQSAEKGDVLQLCDEKEKKDGFKCVCEPGFKPPYCEAPADACFNHLCINGAQCIAKTPFNYECKCNPGTSGTLCEYVSDYCKAFGDRVCIHGSCYEDPSSTRQFSCHCKFMFYGRNCEYEQSIVEANYQFIVENSDFIFPAFSVACTFMVLFVVYFTCLSKSGRPEKPDYEPEHPASIRVRKLQVAIEQKMNIIRKKRDEDRLKALLKKLQTPTKLEKGAVQPAATEAAELTAPAGQLV
ncbi:hypothetical protein Q1695_007397 [Nippostrongylus brasiliensis]|nr:hypothetical protein Q1695_007397 [Nippostrongylus brasiliensis]